MNNIIAIYKVVQTTHPGEMFEPTIFSSVGGDDDHNHIMLPGRDQYVHMYYCADVNMYTYVAILIYAVMHTGR
jgi:hypothetical protein